MNWQAQILQRHEKASMCADPLIRERFLVSYDLMLDFYGMRRLVVDRGADTGALARSSNWQARYHNLNTSGHNYLRITRILKCLGEMGFEHFKLPFLTHVYEEIILYGELEHCWSSAERYWAPTLRLPADAAALSASADLLAEDAAAAKACGQRLQPTPIQAAATDTANAGYAGRGASAASPSTAEPAAVASPSADAVTAPPSTAAWRLVNKNN
jgi:hypothetical protein